MGFIKEAKADSASTHATRARREGRTTFLYRQNVPSTSSGWSGPVAGVAEVVEAIEKAGWRLTDMTFDRAQSNHGAVLLLFRLPPPPPQPQPQLPPYGQQQQQPSYTPNHRASVPGSFQ
jgi:hypothetical protein